MHRRRRRDDVARFALAFLERLQNVRAIQHEPQDEGGEFASGAGDVGQDVPRVAGAGRERAYPSYAAEASALWISIVLSISPCIGSLAPLDIPACLG
jgi:hypothetical protein